MKKKKNEWVVYPEVETTVDDVIQHLKMSNDVNPEKIDLRSVKTPEEINALLPKDVEILEDEPTSDVNALNPLDEKLKELTEEEKKAIFIEQLKASKVKFHKYKHPTVTVVTEEKIVDFGGGYHRKKQVRTVVPLTNETVTKFGAEYRKKRQRKNKMAKASRRANR